MAELSRGKSFDVLLTANGFDHALPGAPGEHGQRFRQLFIEADLRLQAACYSL